MLKKVSQANLKPQTLTYQYPTLNTGYKNHENIKGSDFNSLTIALYGANEAQRSLHPNERLVMCG